MLERVSYSYLNSIGKIFSSKIYLLLILGQIWYFNGLRIKFSFSASASSLSALINTWVSSFWVDVAAIADLVKLQWAFAIPISSSFLHADSGSIGVGGVCFSFTNGWFYLCKFLIFICRWTWALFICVHDNAMVWTFMDAWRSNLWWPWLLPLHKLILRTFTFFIRTIYNAMISCNVDTFSTWFFL